MRDRWDFLFYELTVMSCFPYLAFTIAEGVRGSWTLVSSSGSFF